MAVTIAQRDPHWRICLEGQVTIQSAAELKTLLVEWLRSGTDLELDLRGAGEIDITTLQLMWAAARAGALRGAKVTSRLSEAAATVAREAGFGKVTA